MTDEKKQPDPQMPPGRSGVRDAGKPAVPEQPDQASSVKGLFKRINDGLYEYYVAPYRRTFARAQRDEEDLFMLLIFAESLGVPNPAAYYTMELLPVIYDRFHEWHKRMGMEKSPLDHVHCC